MLYPTLKRLMPLSWHTSNGMFKTVKQAKIEVKFLNYSDSKRFLVKQDVVEYEGDEPKHDLILGCKSMKELGVVLDFKTKTITIDEIILPMRNINGLQKSNKIRMLKLNNSLAKEPKSTLDATSE